MSFFKPSVLCVDDNQDSCELIEMMLRNANADYAVKTAASPDEALALISNERFDLYIHDYQFPNVSGAELCRRIRESDSRTSVMFYTGMALYMGQRLKSCCPGFRLH